MKASDSEQRKDGSHVQAHPRADRRLEALSETHDRPWEAIIDAARSRKCDLIVMASHGRKGLAGLLLGSETHKVLTHTSTPVLVCR